MNQTRRRTSTCLYHLTRIAEMVVIISYPLLYLDAHGMLLQPLAAHVSDFFWGCYVAYALSYLSNRASRAQD